jgi:TonB family protein
MKNQNAKIAYFIILIAWVGCPKYLCAQADAIEIITFFDTVATVDLETNAEKMTIVKTQLEIHTNPDEKPFMRNCVEKSIKNKDECSIKKLNEYITKFLDYPEYAKEKGIQGTCNVSFVITESGLVTNVKVIKGINAEMDANAVKVIEKMNQYFYDEPWVPGYHDGKNVATKMVIPIKFAL